MRVMENGVYRDMTVEEIAALTKKQAEEPQAPSLEERLVQLETLLAERGMK